MGTAVRAAWIVVVMSACGKGGGGDKSPPTALEPPPGQVVAVLTDPAPPPAKIDPLSVVVVTEVPAGPLDPPPDGPLVTVAPLQLSFEGAPMAQVIDGRIDPAAFDRATGRIAPLEAFLDTWVKTAPSPRVVKLAVVPELPAQIVVDVMKTFQTIPQRDFALIVRNADGPGALPLRVPETGAPADPVGMTLAFTSDKLLVWSVGGQEGNLRAPKLVVPRDDAASWERVRATLGEIAARRAPARQIVIMIDGGVKTSELVAAMLAVRPAFPDVVLSSGFEERPPLADAVAMEEEDAIRFAEALTGSSDSDNEGDMSNRRPGADLGAMIDNAKQGGATVTVGGGGARGDRDAAPATPTGRITVKRKEALAATSLTADVVLRKIQNAYFSGLKRCYTDGLKVDPALTGDLVLTFRVNATGRAVDAKATAPGDDVDDCVAGQVNNWRFAVPKDDDGEPTEARFEFRFRLVPE